MGSLANFESLSDSKEFSSVYKDAKRWHSEVCVLFYKPSIQNKLAVVASKKVGKAVVRNRAKRLLRAVFLEVCDELESGIYVIVAKNGLNEFRFDKIQKNVRWSLKKLGCLK
ncbi:ribonuclease P protein component [Campylobacter sp. RM9344]|uniref:Ribonuclease P protein component n=1 Tax=Campylobacter californiensis TaxID=1032243 RepID=A0AAW3ZTJ7_9BACT|nr:MULTISPECIES: ribonuclease P protein component [unclassified Campylobacter]MBE2983833.1 ribonuclease P protein component [Campylobacter sp. RM6883]MBE2985603.1 ribonuclease P protein component [Campylobacter sp. RM12919]MBE2987368.1 ribonuclease P protein component [Campylobacter sp. RM12920]MBE2994371.1 ribonuclease P protein component [Campylobacter sp. RM6913]MBE3022169.1 ribonuclease P protein component [Campylobacter sp. 7477a]MBE3028679.1 ribonuclease P protein component [Campylobact